MENKKKFAIKTKKATRRMNNLIIGTSMTVGAIGGGAYGNAVHNHGHNDTYESRVEKSFAEKMNAEKEGMGTFIMDAAVADYDSGIQTDESFFNGEALDEHMQSVSVPLLEKTQAEEKKDPFVTAALALGYGTAGLVLGKFIGEAASKKTTSTKKKYLKKISIARARKRKDEEEKSK